MAITGVSSISGQQIIAAGALSAASAGTALYDENGKAITSYLTAVPEGYATTADLTGKQDVLTFGYDANNAISSINESAIAGGGGTTYTSPSGTILINGSTLEASTSAVGTVVDSAAVASTNTYFSSFPNYPYDSYFAQRTNPTSFLTIRYGDWSDGITISNILLNEEGVVEIPLTSGGYDLFIFNGTNANISAVNNGVVELVMKNEMYKYATTANINELSGAISSVNNNLTSLSAKTITGSDLGTIIFDGQSIEASTSAVTQVADTAATTNYDSVSVNTLPNYPYSTYKYTFGQYVNRVQAIYGNWIHTEYIDGDPQSIVTIPSTYDGYDLTMVGFGEGVLSGIKSDVVELALKSDLPTYEYDSSNKISAINGSAIAGGNYLSSVSTDSNLTGDGTTASALGLNTKISLDATATEIKLTNSAATTPTFAIISTNTAQGLISVSGDRARIQATGNSTANFSFNCLPSGQAAMLAGPWVNNTKWAGVSSYYKNGDASLTVRSSGANVPKINLISTAGTATIYPSSISSWDNKQDSLTFGYDAEDKIVSINESAIAGGGSVPEGTMVESGLEYDNTEISGYSGSAFKDVALTDVVTANSGAWGGRALPVSAGPGIKFEIVNDTLVASTDETVLFENWESPIRGTTATGSLTEPLTSFDSFEVTWAAYGNRGEARWEPITQKFPSYPSNSASYYTLFAPWLVEEDAGTYLFMELLSANDTNFCVKEGRFYQYTTTVTGKTTDMANTKIYKIVGINRISAGE